MAQCVVLYCVFWGEVEKKEVRKGKIVATNVQASSLHLNHMIINSIKYSVNK
jgi:hypothetical protein